MKPRALTLIYILFTLSGFAGLIYESLWSRYLKLLLGHSSYGQILTLMIYMGGLGIGSWIGGRLAPKMKQPLLLYAGAEAAIGLGGLVYHNLYQGGNQLLYQVITQLHPPAWSLPVLKTILACLITSPWAILLGLTFPALAIALMRMSGDQGRYSLPLLYFTNSLGGATGILAASYALIPAYGTIGTLTLAGFVNILLAASFYLLSRTEAEQPDSQSESSAEISPETEPVSADLPAVSNTLVWLLLGVSAITGLSSFIYEVSWLRLLSMVLGSSTHSFDLMVSAFILGLAFGGLFARRLHRSSVDSLKILGWMQLCMGIAAALSLCFYENLFRLFNHSHLIFQPTLQAYPVYSVFKYGVCILLMFPASFFAGTTLPLITWTLLQKTGKQNHVGSVYGWNTIGSILGAYLGGLVLLPALQLKWTLLSGALMDLALGLLLLSVAAPSLPVLAGAALASLILVIPAIRMQFDNFTLAAGLFRGHVNLDSAEQDEVKIRDGRTATISFHTSDNRLVIKTNGKPDASLDPLPVPGRDSDEVTQLALAIYPMNLMQQPYRAAMVGLGSGMTANTMLGDPMLEHLDVIEIEPVMYEMAKGFLPFNERVYKSPKVKMVFDDAKSYFFSQQKPYDLIVSEPSNPWVSGVSSLFSEEFYAYVRRFLTPKGVLVQWMHTYEFEDELLLSILAALDKNFKHVAIYGIPQGLPGEITLSDVIILASQEEIVFPEPLREIPELDKDLLRVGKKQNAYSRRSLIASNRTLKPLIELYNPNSDYYPIVDNGAERAFYVNARVNLFQMLYDTPGYYQSLYEPEYEKVLNDRLQGRKPEMMSRLYQLNTLFLLPNSIAKYDQLKDTFDNLIERTFPLLNFKEPILQAYGRFITDSGIETHILEFKILEAIKTNPKAVPALLREALEKAKPSLLHPPIVRLMAIYCLSIGEKDMYNQILARWAVTNPGLSTVEKQFMAAINPIELPEIKK